MGVGQSEATDVLDLARGRVRVEVFLRPLSIRIRRGEKTLIDGLTVLAEPGEGHDQLITLTEGVMPREERREPEPVEQAIAQPSGGYWLRLAGWLRGGRAFELSVSLPDPERVLIEFSAMPAPFRLTARWTGGAEQRLTGLGARHGHELDQAGRCIQLGADRSYTGPDCPPDMLEVGGIPQGDYAPAPWLLSSHGWALWLDSNGPGAELDLADGVAASIRAAAGDLKLHLLTDPTPAARLRHYCRLTGMPDLLPEWGYGFWKSRDVYEHANDVIDDFEGHRDHSIPLDAIVIDSPWETQYNTWRFNPHQFPDARGLIRRMREAGVRTVLWTTPWVNIESSEGQRPPDPESERLHQLPASNYGAGERRGHYVRDSDGAAYVGKWWMGTGSPVDFTSRRARRWWRRQARGALRLGAEGIKADDGEGYYMPPDALLADGRCGAEAAWAYPDLYHETMQAALDDVHPGRGVLFARSGWSGTQRRGMLWGGDQASDFWSLRALVGATLTAAASGFSNWSHDVGGYLGKRLVERCPAELLLRWVQFGCFTPLMQAHGRFPQEAWRYDAETLRIYREFVLLHERLVPYVRAAAATAARSGLPIIRPLCLTDPDDPRGWRIADAYGYGPSLWVAPVLDEHARERPVELPAGEWIDWWGGERAGGEAFVAEAALDRIPIWVRSGSIVVTHPADHVARGLGDEHERGRPLEVTLWGRPRHGRTGVRLADGTRIEWRRGEWSVSPEREVSFRER